MDYQVFLLSRIHERWAATDDTPAAIVHGVASTARLITGAAAIIIVVFSGFASGQLVAFQEMGFGIAIALALDATLVRLLLIPAAMRLLGERNWYLPGWLSWLPNAGRRTAASPRCDRRCWSGSTPATSSVPDGTGPARASYDFQVNADMTTTQRREVVVIGGGQAGLAVGYHLAQQHRRFTILEAAGEPASAWRGRWDSLRLFTSVRYDSLPGLDFPGDPNSYPSRDEVIAYLSDYAQRFELPVEFNSRVQAVRARDGGGFLVELADRTYEADQVVAATGPFHAVHAAIAAGLEPEVVAAQQPVPLPGRPPDRHGAGGGRRQHRLPDQRGTRALAGGPSGHRRPSMPLPQRILGRDLFRYLHATGLMYKTVDSRLARRLKDKETLIGSSPRAARKRGIQLRPRATAASGTTVTFADGSELTVDGVVGDRLPARPLLRGAPRLRRGRSRDASARRHRRPWLVLPRHALAAHAARRWAGSKTTRSSSPNASTRSPKTTRPRRPYWPPRRVRDDRRPHYPATTCGSDRIHRMDRAHRGVLTARECLTPSGPCCGGARHSRRSSRHGAADALGTPEFHRSVEPGAST